MQNAGQQYGQGGASSHQTTTAFGHSETTATSGSITSSLRQFRRKPEEKHQQQDATQTTVAESHVARVAPHNHFPHNRASDCYPRYPLPYQDYSTPSQVKYSEISEPHQPIQDHISPSVIQKAKGKEYMEMCNIQQPHMKQPYADHLNGQQAYHDPSVLSQNQYIPKEAQVQPLYKPESQYYPKEHQYANQLPHQMQKYNMPTPQVRKFPENDFLSKLQRIHPTMARSIMSDHHLQESQRTYQNMDQSRMYPHHNQRYMNHTQSMQGNMYPHSYMPPQPYSNYPASCSYTRSQQMGPRFPAINPHERSISPRRTYSDGMTMTMGYGGMPQKISPNYHQYNSPDYSQHYQQRRSSITQDYYQQHCRPTQYMPHQMPPQEIPESRVTVSDNIKQYIENWADEETASEMNQMENNRMCKENIRVRDDQPTETVYTINASELQYLEPLVASENGIPLVASENGQYIIKSGVSIDNTSGMIRIIDKNNQMDICDPNGERIVNLHIMDPLKPDCMLANKPNEMNQRQSNENLFNINDKSRVVIHQNTVIQSSYQNSNITKEIEPAANLLDHKLSSSLPIITDDQVSLEEELNRTIIRECRKETADKNCSPINLEELEALREEESMHSTVICPIQNSNNENCLKVTEKNDDNTLADLGIKNMPNLEEITEEIKVGSSKLHSSPRPELDIKLSQNCAEVLDINNTNDHQELLNKLEPDLTDHQETPIEAQPVIEEIAESDNSDLDFIKQMSSEENTGIEKVRDETKSSLNINSNKTCNNEEKSIVEEDNENPANETSGEQSDKVTENQTRNFENSEIQTKNTAVNEDAFDENESESGSNKDILKNSPDSSNDVKEDKDDVKEETNNEDSDQNSHEISSPVTKMNISSNDRNEIVQNPSLPTLKNSVLNPSGSNIKICDEKFVITSKSKRSKRIFSVDDIINNIGNTLNKSKPKEERRYSLQSTREFLDHEIDKTSLLMQDILNNKGKSKNEALEQDSNSVQVETKPSSEVTKTTSDGTKSTLQDLEPILKNTKLIEDTKSTLEDDIPDFKDSKSSLEIAKPALEDKSALEDPKHDVEDAKPDLEDAKSALEDLKHDVEDAKPDLEDAKSAVGDAKSTVEDMNSDLADTKFAEDETKPYEENIKSAEEDAELVAENTKSAVEDSKSTSEDAKPDLEETKCVKDDTTSILRDTKSALEDANSDLEYNTSSLEVAKPPLEATKSIVEDTKPDLEDSKQNLKHTKHDWNDTTPLKSCKATLDDSKTSLEVNKFSSENEKTIVQVKKSSSDDSKYSFNNINRFLNDNNSQTEGTKKSLDGIDLAAKDNKTVESSSDTVIDYLKECKISTNDKFPLENCKTPIADGKSPLGHNKFPLGDLDDTNSPEEIVKPTVEDPKPLNGIKPLKETSKSLQEKQPLSPINTPAPLKDSESPILDLTISNTKLPIDEIEINKITTRTSETPEKSNTYHSKKLKISKRENSCENQFVSKETKNESKIDFELSIDAEVVVPESPTIKKKVPLNSKRKTKQQIPVPMDKSASNTKRKIKEKIPALINEYISSTKRKAAEKIPSISEDLSKTRSKAEQNVPASITEHMSNTKSKVEKKIPAPVNEDILNTKSKVEDNVPAPINEDTSDSKNITKEKKPALINKDASKDLAQENKSISIIENFFDDRICSPDMIIEPKPICVGGLKEVRVDDNKKIVTVIPESTEDTTITENSSNHITHGLKALEGNNNVDTTCSDKVNLEDQCGKNDEEIVNKNKILSPEPKEYEGVQNVELYKDKFSEINIASERNDAAEEKIGIDNRESDFSELSNLQEIQYRNVIRVEESSVLLHIAGELVEINVNTIAGKKVITVVPLSSSAVVDLNDNYETLDSNEDTDPLKLDTEENSAEIFEVDGTIPQSEFVEPTSEIIIGMDLNLEEEIQLDLEQPQRLCTKAAKKAYDCDLQIPSITTSEDVYDQVKSSSYCSNDKVSSSREQVNFKKRKVQSASLEQKNVLKSNKNKSKVSKKREVSNPKIIQNVEEDDDFVPFKELIKARKLKKLKMLEKKNCEEMKADSTNKVEEFVKESAKEATSNECDKVDKKDKTTTEKKNDLKKLKPSGTKTSNKKVQKPKDSTKQKDESSKVPSLESKGKTKSSKETLPKTKPIKKVTFNEIVDTVNEIKEIKELSEEDKNNDNEGINLSETTIIKNDSVDGKKKLSLEEYNKRKRKMFDKLESERCPKRTHTKVPDEILTNVNVCVENNSKSRFHRPKSLDDVNSLKCKENNIIKRSFSVETCTLKSKSTDWEETDSPNIPITEKHSSEHIGPSTASTDSKSNVSDTKNAADEILQNYKEQVESKLSSLNIQIPRIAKPLNKQVTTIINPFSKSETTSLMQRFLRNERVTPEEMQKIRQIISYKRLMQSIKNTANPTLSLKYEVKKELGERDMKLHLKKLPVKKRKKRFRNLYSESTSETDTDRSESKAPGDYSVVQSNCLAGVVPKLIIKRKPELPLPFVKLERLDMGVLINKKRRYSEQ